MNETGERSVNREKGERCGGACLRIGRISCRSGMRCEMKAEEIVSVSSRKGESWDVAW